MIIIDYLLFDETFNISMNLKVRVWLWNTETPFLQRYCFISKPYSVRLILFCGNVRFFNFSFAVLSAGGMEFSINTPLLKFLNLLLILSGLYQLSWLEIQKINGCIIFIADNISFQDSKLLHGPDTCYISQEIKALFW